jgi:hypothetical protein
MQWQTDIQGYILGNQTNWLKRELLRIFKRILQTEHAKQKPRCRFNCTEKMKKALGLQYGVTQQFNYRPRDLPCKTEAKKGEEKVDSAMREEKKGMIL